MSNQDFLVNHALQKVWCEPTQDFQFTLTPSRYTRGVAGAVGRVTINQFTVDLPPTGEPTFFHVYHIGRIPDASFDLSVIGIRWKNALVIANDGDHVIDVFLINGRRVPLSHCWLRRIYDGNILLAIKNDKDIDYGSRLEIDRGNVSVVRPLTIGSARVSVRFYKSARAKQPEWRLTASNPDDPIHYHELYIGDVNAFQQFMQDCNDVEGVYAGQGVARYFVDGCLVEKPTAYSDALYQSRVLGFYYDSLVIQVVSRPVSTLANFVSTLDTGSRKLLFLLEAEYLGIHYHDDVDFYLRSGVGVNSKAIYIGRLSKDTVRQVTHNAYAIHTETINALIGSNDFLTNHEQVDVVAYVREGGRLTGLTQQSNRIEDLYLLPYDEIYGAMVGINATVHEWQAGALEASAYTRIMRSRLHEITPDLVIDAYGYHALGKVAYSPAIISDGTTPFPLRNGYRLTNGTADPNLSIFSYSEAGVLVNAESLSVNASTLTLAPSVDGDGYKHELINLGLSDEDDGTYIDQDVATPDLLTYGFRAYVCGLNGGVPTEEWYDVTGGVYYTLDTTGPIPEVRWNYGLLSIANLFPAVRIANKVLFYSVELQTTNYPGIIRFSIVSKVDWFGTPTFRIQNIPADTLDVFMDGHPLIEGIDYHVKWPEVVVTRKPASDPADTMIQVRTIGYAKDNPLSHRPPREIGFARGGLLSVNGRYDPRNDRNVKVFSAGKMMAPSEVRFSETSGAANPLVPDGSPYLIDDQRLNIELLTGRSTIMMVDQAEAIDRRVSDYLSPRVDEIVIPVGFIELGRWEVVSPLLSALTHAMLNSGYLDDELTRAYDTGQMDQWIAPYAYLLWYEPILNGADLYFMNILPHQYDDPLTVTVEQYLFLERVSQHYLHGSVDLTPHLMIGA